MGQLSKAAILAAAVARTELVPVPEWGGEVAVRMLTGAERDAVFSAVQRSPEGVLDMPDYRARLVAAAAVAEDGAPLFTTEEARTLDDTAAPALLRLFVAAQRINGLGGADVEAARGN